MQYWPGRATIAGRESGWPGCCCPLVAEEANASVRWILLPQGSPGPHLLVVSGVTWPAGSGVVVGVG